MFIDREFLQAKRALSCIANMLIFLTWIYEKGRDTFWGKQLFGIFDLFVSDAGRLWLDYIVFTHPYIPFNIIMECQVIQQAVFINMVKIQPWPKHTDNNLEIPFD